MRNYVLALICSLIVLLAACGDDSSFPGPEPIIPADGRILFEVNEGYDSPIGNISPSIKIYSETEDIYENYNYKIITDIRMDIEYSAAIVAYNGIQVPEIILPALGPATSYVDLPLGSHTRFLTLNLYGRSDHYQVELTDSYIKLTPMQADFSILTNDLFWRYRENSFVFLYSTNSENYDYYEAFLDTLESAVNLQEFSYPDSGKIPYMQARNWQYPESPPRYFSYQTSADFVHVEEIFEAYVSGHLQDDTSVWMRIINWRNIVMDSRSL